jgi:hypothetical protein
MTISCAKAQAHFHYPLSLAPTGNNLFFHQMKSISGFERRDYPAQFKSQAETRV